jgi:hypothetical protein
MSEQAARRTRRLTTAVVVLLLGLPVSSRPADGTPTRDAAVDEHRAVICLLPGRIRKLGGRTTYVEARRPIETTAPDCEIRGGEYTSYDRANYETALGIWKDAAGAGDAKAMTYVGEIYEKRLGAPDYAEAAAWYRRAAEAGDERGMRNLAYLTERGLGVPQDTRAALDLWRRAAGIDETLVLASELEAARSEAERRIADLTRALDARSAETARLRQQLAASDAALAREREAAASAAQDVDALRSALAEARSRPPDAGAAERIAALERDLRARESTLADREAAVALLGTELEAQRAQIQASAKASDIQSAQLANALDALAAERAERSTLAQALSARDQEISALEAELAQAKRVSLGEETAQRALEAELADARREAEANRATSQRVDTLRRALERSRATLAEKEARVAALEDAWQVAERAAVQARSDADTAEQSRTVLEARLAATEAELERARAAAATLEGRIREGSEENGRLRRELAALENASTTPAASAVDRALDKIEEMRRSIALRDKQIEDLKFELWKQNLDVERLADARASQVARVTRSFAPPAVPVSLPPGVRLGRYHALLIANSDYALVGDLASPRTDVRMVQQVLEERYGFTTDVRFDLTRAQMYAALKDLQAYDEDALVLVYYGGHGAIDERGDGYWLPTDFEPGQPLSAVAIPNEQVTKHLNMMRARHVMVVADSCYSGALFREAMPAVVRDVRQRLKFFVENPSRTILTSGGDEPVLDAGADGHSIFARAFVDTLASNEDLTYGEAIYARLASEVRAQSTALDVPQSPRFAGLADAGHGNGQFVFRPQARAAL